jgi:hypothetical protein
MNSDQINQKLYESGSIEGYDSTNNYNAHLLEQYKIYLTSAENISNRRQTANAFFVTVNTALVSLISYLNLGATNPTKLYWIVSIAGIAISFMWYRLIRSYKDLNSAKFKVVHEIEKGLPISPYDAEWEAVGRGENSKLYLPFTHIEIFIPWVFLILHVLVLAVSTYEDVMAFICKIAS